MSRSISLGKTTSAGMSCVKEISFPSLGTIIFKGKYYLLLLKKCSRVQIPLRRLEAQLLSPEWRDIPLLCSKSIQFLS